MENIQPREYFLWHLLLITPGGYETVKLHNLLFL